MILNENFNFLVCMTCYLQIWKTQNKQIKAMLKFEKFKDCRDLVVSWRDIFVF